MATCNLTIESLAGTDLCENNMSGVKVIYFIPKDDVESINVEKASTLADFEDFVTLGDNSLSEEAISVASGKGFAKMFCAKDLGELKYATQGSILGGRSLKATLEVFHPKFKKKLLGFLSVAMNLELIIVAKLNNGEYHLLGDLDRGAQLADGVEATSGKAVTDDNGATLNFEYDTPFAQIFYDGWDPTDNTVGLPMIEAASSGSGNGN